MKKFLKIFGLITLVLVILIIGILTILTIDKNNQDKQITRAKTQIANYNNYKFGNGEFNKLKQSDKNDIYYYGADGKKYIFPDEATYQSWFATISPSDIMKLSLADLYKTPIGGNVTLRPGTLMQTPTDPNIYLVVKNGQISAFNDQTLSTKLYGENWQKSVISIANFYFTNYKLIGSINSIADYPEIPVQITIDQDKGLK